MTEQPVTPRLTPMRCEARDSHGARCSLAVLDEPHSGPHSSRNGEWTDREQPVTALSTRPTTTNGLGLAGALRKARTMPDPEVDWGEWIAAVEREAVADLRASLVAGLDVDVLAKAIDRVRAANDYGLVRREDAAAIAAEYARLIEEATDVREG